MAAVSRVSHGRAPSSGTRPLTRVIRTSSSNGHGTRDHRVDQNRDRRPCILNCYTLTATGHGSQSIAGVLWRWEVRIRTGCKSGEYHAALWSSKKNPPRPIAPATSVINIHHFDTRGDTSMSEHSTALPACPKRQHPTHASVTAVIALLPPHERSCLPFVRSHHDAYEPHSSARRANTPTLGLHAESTSRPCCRWQMGSS
ncbi:hypothetical protein COCMIDRAFT_28890 [Bipolaris oryzae ATCC 44560]|uniref:Uncharacterized protein n=1 Tax=Bipolaris oryzae ATCC 44560 TaxID=930090 RepID=W6YY56_COCMI|nr:uncharacterized protein COCMIDRAFT_28890 [Bipolaris oryzae ATCC 44560]EUC42508.1 hypothetical protein COCMIDRAFT_28890 [Bipolaris oryzae ATCC 44560]